MATLPRTDVHQHLWAPELLAALARRSEPPCARYEPEAVVLMRRAVGSSQLVHGSDVPVLAASAAPDDETLLRTNPARLLR